MTKQEMASVVVRLLDGDDPYSIHFSLFLYSTLSRLRLFQNPWPIHFSFLPPFFPTCAFLQGRRQWFASTFLALGLKVRSFNRFRTCILTNALQDSSPTAAKGSIPPPLNIPPSRARMQLAARLAAKKKEAETSDPDPDIADNAAVATASHLPEDPSEGSVDLAPAVERDAQESGLQITGLRVQPRSDAMGTGASRFSGLFNSDDSSSSSGDDEYGGSSSDGGNDEESGRSGANAASGLAVSQEEKEALKQHRRPSTTEAKTRRPLDEDDDDDDDEFGSVLEKKDGLGGEGPFADPEELSSDSSDDEPVEIKPTARRAYSGLG